MFFFLNTLFWCSVYVATFVDRHCALFLLLGWLIGWFGQISGCARCRICACFYLNFKSDELCAALTSLSQTNWIFTPQISLPPPAFDRLCLSTHVFIAAHYSPPPKSPHSCRRGWSYLLGEGRGWCAPCGGCGPHEGTGRQGRHRRRFAAAAGPTQHQQRRIG